MRWVVEVGIVSDECKERGKDKHSTCDRTLFHPAPCVIAMKEYPLMHSTEGTASNGHLPFVAHLHISLALNPCLFSLVCSLCSHLIPRPLSPPSLSLPVFRPWNNKMARTTLNRFKNFDAYAKTLDDFRVKTSTGAIGNVLGTLTSLFSQLFERAWLCSSSHRQRSM